jgi:hypothetical protein
MANGGNEASVRQARDEGLSIPQARRGRGPETRALCRAAPQAGEVGFDGCLINEHEPLGGPAHGGHAPRYPVFARSPDTGFAALIGNEALFLNA